MAVLRSPGLRKVNLNGAGGSGLSSRNRREEARSAQQPFTLPTRFSFSSSNLLRTEEYGYILEGRLPTYLIKRIH